MNKKVDQGEVLEKIKDYFIKTGFYPTVRELAAELDVSHATIGQLISSMCDSKVLIRYKPSSSRPYLLRNKDEVKCLQTRAKLIREAVG